VERQGQRQGYKTALTQLLLRRASTEELAALHHDYGIEPDTYEVILKELHGDASPLIARIRKQIERLLGIPSLINALSPLRLGSLHAAFVIDILFKPQEQYLGLIKEALSTLGDSQFQEQLERLNSLDPNEQALAWEFLSNSLGADFTEQLRAIYEFKVNPMTDNEADRLYSAFEALLDSPDVYHRAGTAWLPAEQSGDEYEKLLKQCVEDKEPLVRETAMYVTQASEPAASQGFAKVCPLEKMLFLHQVPLFADLNPDDLRGLPELSQEITI